MNLSNLSATSPSPDLSMRSVAYFSMEIALAPSLPTYSGGLGILAGDTLRSAADMGVPLVAVSLVHRCGYFRQHLDATGQQTESDVPWSPEDLPGAGQIVPITLQGRQLLIRAWRYDVTGVTGHVIPVFLLDTDVEGNEPWDRHLTDHLYGGDAYYRLCQEAILGLGGIAMLHALGCRPDVYHMNEGHAALLTVGLVAERVAGSSLDAASDTDIESVREHCIFTTHTPVPAGHDQFGLDQMYHILGHERAHFIERTGCLHNGLMNVTYIALHFSRYVNGVAMQHGKVSQQMFPEYPLHAITNGVHAATWLSQPFQALLDTEVPSWRTDNQYFRSVYGIPSERIMQTHRAGKLRLLEKVAERTGQHLDPNMLTLGFARRVATYKRASLLFQDGPRLASIAEKIGGLQILFAGKAHPADTAGKQLIKDVFDSAAHLNCSALRIIYLENYDWELGALLTQGVDVWVNTPRRPYEASGTSGMKAALNGVPSLSILDGWWIEGCAENTTGWAIEDGQDDAAEAAHLYDKLESAVAPMYRKPTLWADMQRHCIAINGSFFNTHRMVQEYLQNAYFPQTAPERLLHVQSAADPTVEQPVLA